MPRINPWAISNKELKKVFSPKTKNKKRYGTRNKQRNPILYDNGIGHSLFSIHNGSLISSIQYRE